MKSVCHVKEAFRSPYALKYVEITQLAFEIYFVAVLWISICIVLLLCLLLYVRRRTRRFPRFSLDFVSIT